MSLERTVEIKIDNTPISRFPNEYCILYVSGSKATHLAYYTDEDWPTLMRGIYNKYRLGSLPIVIVGAQYDRRVLDRISNWLRQQGFHVFDCYQHIAKTCSVIKNAKFFVGYQSGLSIIAENFNTPQIMLYYDYLKPMIHTWCKTENIDNGIYNPFFFSQKPKELIEKLRMKI